MSDAEVLTVDELSALLRIGRNQCYEMVRRGEVPGVTWVNGRIRISRHAIDKWLDLEPENNLPHDEEQELLNLLDQAQPLIQALQPILSALTPVMNTIREHDGAAKGGTEETQLTGGVPLNEQEGTSRNGSTPET